MAERLSDAEVEARLARLDEVLGELDRIPGATSRLGVEAVRTLSEVYGAALGRVLDAAADSPALLAAFDRDELVRHLLVLHDLHPQPLPDRVEAALERVRPYLNSHGGDVSLVSLAGGVARVELTGHCDGCTSSTETMRDAISAAVLAVAPELADVVAEPATAPAHPAPVIPVDALLKRPAVRA